MFSEPTSLHRYAFPLSNGKTLPLSRLVDIQSLTAGTQVILSRDNFKSEVGTIITVADGGAVVWVEIKRSTVLGLSVEECLVSSDMIEWVVDFGY